jgi:hypothetical protein
MLWYGTYLMYRYYTRRGSGRSEYSLYSTYYSRLWSPVIYLLSAILIYALIEATVLLRNVWPEPTLDKYESSHYKTKDSGTDGLPPLARMVGDSVSYSAHTGRPTVEQIFTSSRNAVKPGIFVCAPVSLGDAVKQEARLANSPFLLKTRYCVYDEPFDM